LANRLNGHQVKQKGGSFEPPFCFTYELILVIKVNTKPSFSCVGIIKILIDCDELK
jgi:hypothetical protein